MVLVLCSKPHLSISFAVQGCRSEGGNIGGRQIDGHHLHATAAALAAGLPLCKGYIACCVHFTHLYSISKPDCEGEAVLM